MERLTKIQILFRLNKATQDKNITLKLLSKHDNGTLAYEETLKQNILFYNSIINQILYYASYKDLYPYYGHQERRWKYNNWF